MAATAVVLASATANVCSLNAKISPLTLPYRRSSTGGLDAYGRVVEEAEEGRDASSGRREVDGRLRERTRHVLQAPNRSSA